jgi:hypothetical protein
MKRYCSGSGLPVLDQRDQVALVGVAEIYRGVGAGGHESGVG